MALVIYKDNSQRLVDGKTLQFLLEIKNIKQTIKTYKYLSTEELEDLF